MARMMLMSIPIWSAKLPVSQYERILSISGGLGVQLPSGSRRARGLGVELLIFVQVGTSPRRCRPFAKCRTASRAFLDATGSSRLRVLDPEVDRLRLRHGVAFATRRQVSQTAAGGCSFGYASAAA